MDLPLAVTPEPLEPWERVAQVALQALPFLGLAVAAVFDAVAPAGGPTATTLPLAALAGVWMLSGTVAPAWAVAAERSGTLFVTVLLALLAVLCLLVPWYGFLTVAGYVYSSRFLRGRARGVAVVACAACASLAQGQSLRGLQEFPLLPLGLLAFNVPVGGGLTYLSVRGDEKARRRQQDIADLRLANERLERLSAENAGLHAQLLVQAREAGVLDERARLAREIHDTLAQGLTGIIAQLQAARELHAGRGTPDGDAGDRHVRTALDLARESLAEARRSVRAMSPPPLEAATLPDALADVARAWSGRSGVPAEVRVTGAAVQMHAEIEAALLRTAQEALTNVAKHAGAGRVVVTLSYLGDQVALDVIDDGSGFDPGSVVVAGSSGSGFGLLSMRQRVQRLAGTFEVDSEPGGGTAVSARVPAIGA